MYRRYVILGVLSVPGDRFVLPRSDFYQKPVLFHLLDAGFAATHSRIYNTYSDDRAVTNNLERRRR